MEKSEVTIATLDNKLDITVTFDGVSLSFGLRGAKNVAETFHFAAAAIAALQSRGYAYAEEMVRLAVESLWADAYAA